MLNLNAAPSANNTVPARSIQNTRNAKLAKKRFQHYIKAWMQLTANTMHMK